MHSTASCAPRAQDMASRLQASFKDARAVASARRSPFGTPPALQVMDTRARLLGNKDDGGGGEASGLWAGVRPAARTGASLHPF